MSARASLAAGDAVCRLGADYVAYCALNQAPFESYADQNERDYEAFAVAVRSGRLTARTGL